MMILKQNWKDLGKAARKNKCSQIKASPPYQIKENSLPGIYIIINSHTKSCYIGQSFDIKQRIKSHKKELKQNKHKRQVLQDEYNNYDISFKIIVIIDQKNRDLLLFLESFAMLYINECKSYKLYNSSHEINGSYKLSSCKIPDELKLSIKKYTFLIKDQIDLLLPFFQNED